MRNRLAMLLAIGITTLACQLDRPSTTYLSNRPLAAPATTETKAAPARRERAALLATGAATDAVAASGDVGQGHVLPEAVDQVPTPTMIIRTGTASLQIDSLEPGIVSLRALAARVGGYVSNTAVQAGPAQYRQATLEIKVPANRFDDLVSGLDPVGKVEALNVSAEDVGEEFTDVSARVSNARRLESRLVELLATRTGRLQDVLSVERELARVREDIERYEGRIRYLQARAAMSSLAVTLHEPLPVVGHPGSSVLIRALERAWRNFVELVAGFIASLGVLVPLVLAGGSIVWGVRRWRRPATS